MMQYISENQIDRVTSATGELLRKEKKVKITIAPEGRGAYWEGGINGHFFRIKTGTEVEVPQSLYALIAQSARIAREGKSAVAAYAGSGKKLG